MRKSLEWLLEADVDDLCNHIIELEGEDVESFLEDMTKEECLDYLIDHHYSEFMEYHSECDDQDFGPMHPNETVEEFLEHEDFEPRD